MTTRKVLQPYDLLKAALDEAEKNASTPDLDEIAFYLGSLPNTRDNNYLRNFHFDAKEKGLLEGKPKLAELVKEMEPSRTLAQAMLMCSQQRNRHDVVGRITDLIIRWQKSDGENSDWNSWGRR